MMRQLVNALRERSQKWEEGLMFVTIQINDKKVQGLVDTGATHNFIVDQVVQMLGLDFKESDNWVKTVNSNAVLVKESFPRKWGLDRGWQSAT